MSSVLHNICHNYSHLKSVNCNAILIDDTILFYDEQ